MQNHYETSKPFKPDQGSRGVDWRNSRAGIEAVLPILTFKQIRIPVLLVVIVAVVSILGYERAYIQSDRTQPSTSHIVVVFGTPQVTSVAAAPAKVLKVTFCQTSLGCDVSNQDSNLSVGANGSITYSAYMNNGTTYAVYLTYETTSSVLWGKCYAGTISVDAISGKYSYNPACSALVTVSGNAKHQDGTIDPTVTRVAFCYNTCVVSNLINGSYSTSLPDDSSWDVTTDYLLQNGIGGSCSGGSVEIITSTNTFTFNVVGCRG